MKLTKAVEQAACILILLATQKVGEPLSTDEISRRLDVSASYMKKITRKLVVKKIIKSVPGNKGGLSLDRDLADIKLLDVIEAVEGEVEIFKDTGLINRVFEGGNYTQKGSELLKNVFLKADDILVEYFSSVSVQDMLSQVFGSNRVPQLNWNETTLAEHIQEMRSEKS